jgi:hypothetical protein
MRKFGNYITTSPATPSTSATTGTYEMTEIHSLTVNNTLQTYPTVSNFNIVSSNGLGVINYSGSRNDGVYPNTNFYFVVSLSNIPIYLVNNAYIITEILQSSGKSTASITFSQDLGNGNYDFSGFDYDVSRRVSLLANTSVHTSLSFRALWNITAEKQHDVSFYLSSSNSTNTSNTLRLGTFSMYRMSHYFSSSFSSGTNGTVQEGSSVTQFINAGTNGVATSGATLRNAYASGGAAVTDVTNMYNTNYTVSAAGSTSARTITVVSDGVVEGTESVNYTLEAFSPINNGFFSQIGNLTAFNIIDPPTAPAFLTSGNKAPILGAGGTSWPPAGYTSLQNASADDASATVPLGFTFFMAGTGYTTAFMGSNTYLTFSAGSTQYSGLSASNPPLPKFMLGAADNSYQRVAYKQSPGNWCKIRYEGNGSTSGTVGTPGITLEITLYNPAFLGTSFYVCEVLIGNHNRPSVVWGAYSASSLYDNAGGYSANSSHVFVSTNTTGTGWKQWANQYVTTATS